MSFSQLVDSNQIQQWKNEVNETFSIQSLLDESYTESYLNTKTLKSIGDDIYNSLSSLLGSNNPKVLDYCSKLKAYRLVTNLDEIKLGTFTRFIDKRNPKAFLAFGGNACGIRKVEPSEEHPEERFYIQIINMKSRHVFNYNFNDYITFQKLSDQEMIVLFSMESCER